LQRFATYRDEEAFAELVQRNGALVLGVCRRVLGHAQDAEDAFQATFLVLARKARSIRRQQSLGSWLYKVAYRTALRARALAAQRKVRETAARERQPVLQFTETPEEELRPVLDEEVRRLPEKYRAPVLLCYLQGRTNEEAARQLHCPTGTLKVRLLRARELLRRRLVRRGVALSLTALLTTCVDQAYALPPVANVSPRAAELAERVLRGMVLTKLKVACAALLTVLLLAFANGLSQQIRAEGPVPPTSRPAKPPRTFPETDRPATDAEPPLLVEKAKPTLPRRS
jgi:RNA polymerase sigma factor (sigma-70 family)